MFPAPETPIAAPILPHLIGAVLLVLIAIACVLFCDSLWQAIADWAAWRKTNRRN